MKLETGKVSRFKSKKFWFKVAGVLVVLSVFYSCGYNQAHVEIGSKKVSYDELVQNIENKQSEVSSLQSKIDDLNQQYSDKQTQFDDAQKALDNKSALESQITDLKSQVSDLNNQIKSKKDQLSTVSGQLIAKQAAPIILPAGKFTVGKDIPAGRYKAVPSGGSSGNFFINDGADANIILGTGDSSFNSSYVFDVSDGDKIETTLSVKYIPIQ